MKNILLAFLIISLFGCKENKNQNSSEVSIINKENVKKKNEVFISVNDTISSFFTNLYVNEIQDKPDMLYLGQKESKTSIIIPTNSSIKIIGGDPFISLFYELKFEKGDSILINVKKIKINQSKQAEYPTFEILNSNKTWSENNMGYLLYKYNVDKKAIEINEGGNFQKNTYDSEKIYHNSINLLDSLKANSSISNNFYSANKTNQKLKFATSKIREAKKQNLEFDIDSFDVKLNDNELLGNKEYISFLRALILYRYFKKDKRVFYSVQFDFINDNETFLNKETKQILLDSYLKSIFFVEKQKFQKYLKKFNSVNKSNEFKNKWQLIVDKQKVNSEKLNADNRNIGILTNLIDDNELTFEEMLLRYKGKLVFVDFWASWCAPCRKEMPFLKDLKSKFNKTELKIIEISIDKDYSAWVRASKLENLSNEVDNYIISNWEKSNLYKNYDIKTIPRYLLFGKDGKIINNDAPRPSEKELVELIKTSI
tara:strand:+ start:58 stop:1509 length:1452 start_codon:yes stop_codon:yes gene_type:complete